MSESQGAARAWRVLIADDESLIRLDLREMLTELGYEVIGEAGDGRAALELARKLQPDIVIMDIKMPEMDGIAVAEELTRRFGVRHWQFTVTATDANRSVIRLARALTGRPKVLVFNGCYHGTVDEAVVRLKDGRAVPKGSSIGPGVDPALTTRVVEFNDVPSLEIDRSSSMPATVATASSRTCETSDSTSCDAAPGYVVRT